MPAAPRKKTTEVARQPITVELEAPSRQLAHPATGEVIDLASAPDEVIAKALDESNLLDVDMRVFKRALQEELLARMDTIAKWTVHGEGWKITGDSPASSEYDVPRLRATLEDLVRAGLVSRVAATRAIKTETTYKAVAAGCNALMRLGGEVEAQIRACRVPKTRRAQVQREGGEQ